jgi:ESCRT-I complex subunit TSG101
MIDLASEDATIDDIIYHLSRALETGRLDAQTFLKSVRTLSREQFMKRALLRKCREVAGLRV